MFWMPDQVRHDELGAFYETTEPGMTIFVSLIFSHSTFDVGRSMFNVHLFFR